MLTATLLALIRSRRAARLYFTAQIIATLALFPAGRWLGFHNPLYAAIFVAVTLPIIETSILLAIESGAKKQDWLAAMCFGLLNGILSLAGTWSYSPGAAIVFGEGLLLSIVGFALLCARASVAASAIGSVSLLLSCFDFGFISNDWTELNKWLPSIIASSAFFLVALVGEEHEHVRTSY